MVVIKHWGSLGTILSFELGASEQGNIEKHAGQWALRSRVKDRCNRMTVRLTTVG